MLLKWLGLQQLLDDLFDDHWCNLCIHDSKALASEESLARLDD